MTTSAEAAVRACLKDSLEQLYPDSDAKSGAQSMELAVPRAGTAAVHVLLNDLTRGEAVEFSLREGDKAVRSAKWFRLIDVPVETNTGHHGFTEKKAGENPHVTRRAPFRVYDAMEPVRSPVKAGAATLALRLHVPIAADHRPGRRGLVVRVRCGGKAQELKLAANVHNTAVPTAGAGSLPYTNWFSIGNMAERHGLKPWGEPHWKMIEQYARFMARARQNTFLVPWGSIFTRTKDGLVLNRKRLSRIVRTFTDAGMHYIEGGHVARRVGEQWTAKRFQMGLAGPLATSKAGKADLAKAAGQLMEEIKRNHWQKRWLQHVTDEPVDENVEDYRKLAAMVREYMPGLPILDATMNTKLVGSVNIWCPQVQEYQRHRDFFRARQVAGDRVWVYTCCVPGGPWLNRLMDMELLRPALIGWAVALYDLEGFLHWGLNQYRSGQDPFKKSVVGHGGGNFLPAGDTHVVYPGKDGPWSSLRLEAQREGLEDYELLKILKARRPKAAKAVLAKAIKGFDDYTKDTKAFRAARKALLEALDEQGSGR